MKLLLPIIFLMPVFLFATEETDDRKVSDLSINELKEIVRLIVEESIEQCTVTGTMEGRAKVNLKVEGEVVAKMTCAIEKESKWIIKKISLNFLNMAGIIFLEKGKIQHR